MSWQNPNQINLITPGGMEKAENKGVKTHQVPSLSKWHCNDDRCRTTAAELESEL